MNLRIPLRAFAALSATASLPLLAQLPAVDTQPAGRGFVVRADFDGDGDMDVVLVDAETGSFRTLRQNAGSFFREGPYASGVSGVTGASAGRVELATRNHLVVASPTDNRLSLIDAIPAAGTGAVPRPLPLPGSVVGPRSVVTGDEFGSSASFDDLLVGSSFNSPPNNGRVEIHRVLGAGSYALSSTENTEAGEYRDASRVVIKSTLGGTVAYLHDVGVSSNLRVVGMAQSGTPTVYSINGMSLGTRAALAPFGGGSLATVLTWVPGSTVVVSRQLHEPAVGTFSTLVTSNINFTDSVRNITIIPKGASSNALLISFGDGSLVRSYDFTPPTTLTLLSTHALGAGEVALGAIATTGVNGFHLLTGDPVTGLVNRSRVFQWDGSQFAQTQDIGGLGFTELGGMTNVFLFAADPFLTPGAALVSRLTARDWTSGAPPTPPGNVIVSAESFLGGGQGLASPTAVNLGAFPLGATYALLSQYRNNISVFGLSKPGGLDTSRVVIAPDSGTFDRTQQVRLSGPSGATIFYRFGTGSPWLTYSDPGAQPSEQSNPAYATWLTKALPLMVFRDTVVQAYAVAGSIKTPIATASYVFSVPPSTLSSLGDGVPDYVKIGLGYNPFLQPPQADAPLDTTEGDDPQSYLQKILKDAGHSIPLRNTTPGAYNLMVRPLSHNGVNTTFVGALRGGLPLPLGVLPDGSTNTGTVITAYSFSGGVLDQGDIAGTGFFPEANARLRRLTADAGSRLFVLGTSENLALDYPFPTPPAASKQGRELVRVATAPVVSSATYSRTYTGGSALAEANAWVAGAAAFYAANTPSSHGVTADPITTGAALVFENWVQRRLMARGVLSTQFDPAAPGYDPANRLSITPYRAIEGASFSPGAPFGVVAVGSADVLGLAAYRDLTDTGHNPAAAAAVFESALRSSVIPSIASLRSVVLDVFRLSSRYAGQFPGAFDQPIDALRTFLLTGSLPIVFTQANPALVPAKWNITPAAFTSLTPADYTSAHAGLAALLALPSARPVADFDLVVGPASYSGACTTLTRHLLGGTYSLFNSDGTRFAFPSSFTVIPGVRVSVRAYTDATFPACSGTALEVISVDGVPVTQVTVIPVASANDSDGNLLGDEWELAFYGAIGNDPWAIPGGDGYTTLQKYLDGKDPLVFASYSENPPADLRLPHILPEPGPVGFLNLRMKFPDAYASKLNFRIQQNANLANPAGWTTVAVPFTASGVDEWVATVPYSSGPMFWRVLLSLP